MTATSTATVVSRPRRPREAVKALQFQVNALLGEIDLIKALPATLSFLFVALRSNSEEAPLVVVESCTDELLKLLPPVQIQRLPENICFRGISRQEFPRSSSDTMVLDILRDGKGCRWFSYCDGILFEVQSKTTTLLFGEYESVPFGPRGVQVLRKLLAAAIQVTMEQVEPQAAFSDAQSAMIQVLPTQFADLEPATVVDTFKLLATAYYSHGGLPPHVIERARSKGWSGERLESLITLVRALPAFAKNAQQAYIQHILHLAEMSSHRFFRGAGSHQVNVLDPRTLKRLVAKDVHSDIDIELLRSNLRPRKGTYEYELALRFRGVVKLISVSSKHCSSAEHPAFDWYGASTVRAVPAS